MSNTISPPYPTCDFCGSQDAILGFSMRTQLVYCAKCKGRNAEYLASMLKEKRESPIPVVVPKKQCEACEGFFSASIMYFWLDPEGEYGFQSRCKNCEMHIRGPHAEIGWIKRVRRGTPAFERWLRRKYNMSLQTYNEMLEKQGGVCASCKMPETRVDHKSKTGEVKRLSVDHDHVTGKNRALLCTDCNMALGNMREDPDRIRALAEYADWCKTR